MYTGVFMKSSGIGGQAVIEGIMMRSGNDIAVAVRKPDGNIEVGKQKTVSPKDKNKIFGWPIIRGIVSFIFSLVIGIRTLTFSASFYMDEEETGKEKKENGKGDDALMFGTVAVSLVLAIAIFMILPYWASTGIVRLFGSDSAVLVAVIEGVLKLAIFLAYISLISLMKDIRRTFQYHGAEHKCINCIESGHELNADNVMKSSKEHRRCGTSFIFFVLFISIIFFIILDVLLSLDPSFDTRLFVNKLARMGLRLLLIPVIAGLSYEFIQWAGNSGSRVAAVLSKPGLWIQGLTTKEPDRDMAEVAIAAVEAVFDWRDYLRKQGIEVSEPEIVTGPETVSEPETAESGEEE